MKTVQIGKLGFADLGLIVHSGAEGSSKDGKND